MTSQPSKPGEIRLHLNDIDELFTAPALNLASTRTIFGSGLDYLISRMRANWMRTNGAIIHLPPEKIEPGIEARVRDVIRRYGRYQIEELRQETVSVRWQALKALQTGAIFLTVCLFLSIFFREVAGLPDFLSRVLGEGFLIAGWV